VIGAGAVVTSAIPDYAIAVGVPAKVIRLRTPPNQDQAASPSTTSALSCAGSSS
jgi:acetyltransferase-like isoleucine patch superfamily enzyme